LNDSEGGTLSNRKRKIAYFLSRFPYLTETFILREMILLRELGLDVYVFSMLPPLPTPVHEQVEEMMPYVYYSPFLFSWRLMLAQFHFLFRSPVRYVQAGWRAIWQTWREPAVLLRSLLLFPKSVYFASQMQELGIDHIHAHFVWVNGIAGRVAADLTGITLSLHPHAFGLFMRDRESLRRQLELADGIVTISDYHRQYIAELCPRWSPDDIRNGHLGLDPEEFKPEGVPPETESVRIISVGSLYEKKGHKFLIDACVELAEKGYAFHCSIVGGGPLQAALQARIDQYCLQDRVSLLGAKTLAEVKDLYRQSDLFALPCVVASSGDRDGMPYVLIEAMAVQLPVITTPVTGIPELVRNGETGLLVPERDARALALAIERLINDGHLRQMLAQQGWQVVLTEFDIHQTAAQLATIFEALVGDGEDALQYTP
jgi:colanic acid/amylovoran biosynthesis glycosyltransferase